MQVENGVVPLLFFFLRLEGRKVQSLLGDALTFFDGSERAHTLLFAMTARVMVVFRGGDTRTTLTLLDELGAEMLA